MADIGLVPFDELGSKVVESLEVIGGVGDGPGFESEPSNHLENGLEVATFLGGRVGVVVLKMMETRS